MTRTDEWKDVLSHMSELLRERDKRDAERDKRYAERDQHIADMKIALDDQLQRSANLENSLISELEDRVADLVRTNQRAVAELDKKEAESEKEDAELEKKDRRIAELETALRAGVESTMENTDTRVAELQDIVRGKVAANSELSRDEGVSYSRRCHKD